MGRPRQLAAQGTHSWHDLTSPPHARCCTCALTSFRSLPTRRAQLVGARGSWDNDVPPLPLMEDASWGGLRLTMVTARHWDTVQEALATALNGTNSAAWQGRRKVVFLQSGTWYLELQKVRLCLALSVASPG